MKDHSYQIADILKKRRIFLNYTALNVSKKLGVSRQTIYAWETGSFNIKTSNLINYCQILGIEYSTLLSNRIEFDKDVILCEEIAKNYDLNDKDVMSNCLNSFQYLRVNGMNVKVTPIDR